MVLRTLDTVPPFPRAFDQPIPLFPTFLLPPGTSASRMLRPSMHLVRGLPSLS